MVAGSYCRCLMWPAADGLYDAQGAFSFRFALVYASLEDVLPRIAQLWEVAQDDSRDGREKAHQRIAEMIAVSCPGPDPHPESSAHIHSAQ